MTNPEQREKIARWFYDREPALGWGTVKGKTMNHAVAWDDATEQQREDAWKDADALAAIIALDPAPESAIPAGMVAWTGGEEAPADWDGGPVLLRDGRIWDDTPYWRHRPNYGDGRSDLIAYTPRPAPDVEARRCSVCTAIVASYSEGMCCHCHEMPWPIATLARSSGS